jgi:G3E family GTPase
MNVKIAVVDASKFHIYIRNFNEFYENQIKNAKTILLSRTEAIEISKLQGVITEIRKINPKAEIVTTPWTELTSYKLLELAESGDEEIRRVKISISKCCGKHHHNNHHNHGNCDCKEHGSHNHTANEVFQVWGEETVEVFSFSKLKKFISQLADEKRFGRVLRGKGILKTDEGWKKFDYVPEEQTFLDIEPDFTGRVCIIGADLNKEAIKQLFQEGRLL